MNQMTTHKVVKMHAIFTQPLFLSNWTTRASNNHCSKLI